MKISIIIPVYNSQECVEILVKQVYESLKDLDYELILVNDCSPDNSWLEIKNAVKKDNHVVGINLRKNAGQDNAIMAGFSKVKGRYVVVMDDDLQHNPDDIKNLIQEMEKTDVDVCFANFITKNQKFWKNLGSWLNGKMAEIIINKPSYVYLSPFKVIKKEIMDEIIRYKGPYPYVDGLIFSITQNVGQISIEHHKRIKGESNYTLIRSIKVWLKLMTGFSVFPLRIATIIGTCVSVFGFVLAGYYLFRYIFVG